MGSGLQYYIQMDDKKFPYSGFKGGSGSKPAPSAGFKPSPSKVLSHSQIPSFHHNQPISDFYTSLGVNQSIESNLDHMKQQRLRNLEKELSKGFSSEIGENVLRLYDGAGRRQEVMHIPSSLMEPTLENVEAQLEAHRMTLQPLEQRYFEMKGIKHPFRSEPSNTQEIKGINSQKQAKELIYKLKTGEIGAKSKRQLEQQELERLFQEKKKMDPKLAEYDRKFREYKLEKEAIEHTKGQQMRQSQNKRVAKDREILQRHQQDHEEEMEKLQLWTKYDESRVLATKNDKFISKYIFKQLDKENKSIVSKEQLYDFLLQNQVLMDNFRIDQKWFYSDLEMADTKRKGLMSVEEVTQFLVENKLKQHPEIELVDPGYTAKTKSNCLLGTSELNRLEELFESIDKLDDKIVPREELISVIYCDEYMISRLNNPAINIPQLNKTVALKQVLELILKEYRGARGESKKKAKEYITLKQFLGYFSEIPVDSLQEEIPSTQESVIFDMDAEHLELLKDIFDRVPRVYQNYIAAIDFVEECRRDPQFKLIQEDICRIQSVETRLAAESIKLVVNRIGQETDEFQNWETIRMFFSRRGRPVGWNLEKIKKKRELRERERKEQFNKMLKGMDIEQKQRYLDSMAVKAPSGKLSSNGINYTFPKPFNITDERRKSQGRAHCTGMLDGQKEFQELKVGIESLPLNKEILQPRLDEIERKRKLRSEKNKEERQKKLLNTQQPFSFHERDVISKILKEAMEKQGEDSKEQGIKIAEPPENLKKTYKEVMEQQERKRQEKKQKEKEKEQAEVSKRLYPDDPASIQKDKNKKVLEKIKKITDIQQKMKEEQLREKQKLAEKNKEKEKKHREMKEQEERERKEREEMMDKNEDLTYKPKIKDFKDTGVREQGKRKREEKEKKEIEEMVRRKEEQRKKRLDFKPQEEPKLEIDDMDQEDIIDRLSEISLSDLLEEEEKEVWVKRRNFEKIPFSNKYKTNKERQRAIMMRERKQMEQEERARREEVRNRLQSKLDRDKDEVERNVTTLHDKNKDKRLDPKSLNSKFPFNQSKALRRYYDLMVDKDPLSQYDRMSQQAPQP